MPPSLALAILFTLLTFGVYLLARRRSKPPYPPGPQPHPLWTNVRDVPQDKPWVVYDGWKKKYGDIIHLQLMNQHLIILNSSEMCIDLLDKRSAKYSDRPRLVMLCELMGWAWALGTKHYAEWRAPRRLFHQFFNENAVGSYQEAQEHYSRVLVKRLLDAPEDLQSHLRLLFAEVMMSVVYSIDVNGPDDIYVKMAQEALHAFTIAGTPGTFLVDVIPALKYAPSWLPGAGFQNFALQWRKSVLGARDLPFAHVKKAMARGDAKPSVLSAMLNKCTEDTSTEDSYGSNTNMSKAEECAADAAGAAYAGGADTTLAALQMLFLVIAKYPEIQKEAQAELDEVIRPGHLPTRADWDNLPYMQALIMELLRWHNIAPLGLPHTLMEDDTYGGYFLPKGSTVLANIWSILHDPERFPEPNVFKPTRWLITNSGGKRQINESMTHPVNSFVFGFGRRICPGRYFAVNTLRTVTPYILTCYDVSPRSGDPNDLSTDVTSGIISYPVPYEVCIKPRSLDTIKMIGEL